MCVIATALVHRYYWKETQDIAAPIDDLVKTEEVKTVDVPDAAGDVSKDVEAGGGEAVTAE